MKAIVRSAQEQLKVENETALQKTRNEAERAKLEAMASAETRVAAETAEQRAKSAANLEVAEHR